MAKVGRKTWDKELEMKNLWDLSVPVLKRALKSKDTKESKRIEIALFLVGKMTPSNMTIEHTDKLSKGECADRSNRLKAWFATED